MDDATILQIRGDVQRPSLFSWDIYKFSQSSNQISGMPEKVQSPYEEYKQRPKKTYESVRVSCFQTDSNRFRYL